MDVVVPSTSMSTCFTTLPCRPPVGLLLLWLWLWLWPWQPRQPAAAASLRARASLSRAGEEGGT